MSRPASPRHPFKALVAVAATAALVHGFCAHAGTRDDDGDVSRVDVVGALPLHEACPDVDDGTLADELATAWQDAPRGAVVTVNFKVQGRHVYDVAPQTGSVRTFHQIRHAVHQMSCDGGDDRAHAVRFVVRFVDEPGDAPRVAMITEADDDSER